MPSTIDSEDENNLYLICRLIKSVGLHVKLITYPLPLVLYSP